MKPIRSREVHRRKRRIERRLEERDWPAQDRPMFRARNVLFTMAERQRVLATGGIAAFQLLAQRLGLAGEIDRRLTLLKIHKPYFESDHVLNFAFNALCGGTCLEDLELLRNNEAYLDALGTQRIPDPTTAGDFCRRFDAASVDELQDAFADARLRVWREQPKAFFDLAIIEADGTTIATDAECKDGIGLSYDGTWGYHPLVVSLANTQEVLYLLNRSGNRPSHEGAAFYFDKAATLVRRAGFRRVAFRGDTDFSQTRHLDGWDDQGVEFVFGFDAHPTLVALADAVPNESWQFLSRERSRDAGAAKRQPRERIKERIVAEREYLNLYLVKEEVAEFDYRPSACARSYRMVVLKKTISVERGQQFLHPQVRYFFYITNGRTRSAAEVVAFANDRCNQENLHAQLGGGVRALRAPVDTLVSNWAYMVMTALAWNLKAWFALLLPAKGRWRERHQAERECLLRMEFRTFLNAIVRIPAQVVRTGRRIVMRVMAWNPWLHVFFRGADALRAALG